MGEPFCKSDNVQADIDYFKRHRSRKTSIQARQLVNFWQDCTSIIDVGCRSAGFLHYISDRYTKRIATDIYQPAFMGGENKLVEFVHGDFLKLDFGRTFDVVVCMETMEHIDKPDRRDFAKKLLSLANKHLLVSIPYMWKNSKEPIDHNGFHEGHIYEWFRRNDCLITIMSEHLFARFDLL